ncbi:cell division protein ZapD [Pusillimonas sp. CC-YST705]|uniref:Cell division protein ZapD n=1 Tax=Mesopusillimonas faecipullorum TaxID=2755040 RepID=A0ABS8CA22_9BURK|nr:cell division protein ZapD [Mesopusillimonas faecipullorum]MCB5362689.1 cell division protein ZapD [Mesopusillimonas faecipullorum]
MILYEYPCNERVRALLRVEHLFSRIFFFVEGGQVQHHQIAVSTLFELFEICERSDLRGAVLQDLERQRTALSALRRIEGVDASALEATLDDIQRTSSALSGQGRIGQVLRDSEWLSSLRGRLAVPGGSSPADMPSYYAWQIKPSEARCDDIKTWLGSFLPLYDGLALILRLLRESAHVTDVQAVQGAYQEMLAGKTFQLLRVWVARDAGVFPEISANKYVIWVRFSQQDNELRPLPVARDIPFRLARCNL